MVFQFLRPGRGKSSVENSNSTNGAFPSEKLNTSNHAPAKHPLNEKFISQNVINQTPSIEQQIESNEKPAPKKRVKSPLRFYFNPVFLVLSSAGLLSVFQGDNQQALVIVLVLMVYELAQALIQWQCKSIRPKNGGTNEFHYRVNRQGQESHLHASDLQVGDEVFIRSGQPVPADCRLIKSEDVQVDESVLTGESTLVFKRVSQNTQNKTTEDFLYAGTQIRTGSGEAIIQQTFANSTINQITNMASNDYNNDAGYTRTIQQFFGWVALGTVLVLAGLVGLKLYQGVALTAAVEISIMALMAVMPGVLPGLASLLAVFAAKRLGKFKVKILRMKALEFLGNVTTLCCDKTGTLTENSLTVAQLYLPEIGAIPYQAGLKDEDQIPYPAIKTLFKLARLNNSVTATAGIRGHLMGDPLDVALYHATPVGLESNHRKLTELPFDPVRMMSASLFETSDGQKISAIKGAPEVILKHCRYYMRPDGSVAPMNLSAEYITQMFNNDIAFEKDYRIIGFAQKNFTADAVVDDLFEGSTFIGWVCLVDAQREGASETVATLKSNGISPIMITGDQSGTASAAAKKLGILGGTDEVWPRERILQENYDISSKAKVFVRTRPEDKLGILQALQKRGEVVAMIGDGVNDTPALKQSNVAIAMGLSTDSALESADMILVDNRFEGLLPAIKESHALRKKLQTCALYLLSGGLALASFLILHFGLFNEAPFSLMSVLWLSLVVMTLPTLMLAIEPMLGFSQTKPNRELDLLNKRQLIFAAYWAGFILASMAIIYGLFNYVWPQSPDVLQTLLFASIAFGQVLCLFSVQFYRAKGKLAGFIAEALSTPMTWMAMGATCWLQWWAIYTPVMNGWLGTVPVANWQLLICFGVSLGLTLLSSVILDLSRE